MSDLKDIRTKITDIDNKMAELFQERMDLVKKVAEYKKENGLPILDPEREQQVLLNGASRIEDVDLKSYYVNFLKSTMELSRKYQSSILDDFRVEAEGNKGYNIYLEKDALKKAQELFDLDRRVLVVTDSGVPAEYAEGICQASKDAVLVTIPKGEESKNLDTLALLCQKMLENGFTRKDCVVAVGGGVVGDLAGFAASCYMRGVDFYNVPTTLLSQVDSSIGGKTAVDFCGIKNILGAFHQPKAVLIDPRVLETLDERQLACGYAEIIKMAATFDKELFEYIESNGIADNLEEIIKKSLKIKAHVVEEDEKEAGLRKVLNFGHTLGHGIESTTDLLHGECVALGMIPMVSKELRGRLINVLKKHHLPVVCTADVDKVVHAAMHDKKSEGDHITTVRVDNIGSYRLEENSKEELTKYYKEVF